jgi:hypothetical protein
MGGLMSNSAREYDVVVVGGGTAGIIAAVAAASSGARTCLIESSGYLGGTTYALANVVSFHNNRMEPVVGGFPQKIVDLAVVDSGLAASLMIDGHLPNPGGMSGTVTLIDSARLNVASFALLEELGVEIMLHSLATAVKLDGNRLHSVSVTNKGGTHQISAKCFVDASGDADLAVKSGAPYEKDAPGTGLTATMVYRVGKVDHEALVADFRKHPERVILLEDPFLRRNGMTPADVMSQQIKLVYDLPYIYLSNIVRDYIPKSDWPEWGITGTEKANWGRLSPFGSRIHMSASPLSPEIIYVNTTNIRHFDAADPAALSRAEIEAQKQVKLSLEILKRYVPGFRDAFLIGPMPKISVRASCRILGEYQVTQEDVAKGRRFPDAIARGCYPMSVQSTTQPNVRDHLYVEGGGDYDVPYRALIPRGVDGLLIAGRCISATREASGATRTGAQCMAYGHATGTAAAISARTGVSPRNLDVSALQKVLRGQGAIC